MDNPRSIEFDRFLDGARRAVVKERAKVRVVDAPLDAHGIHAGQDVEEHSPSSISSRIPRSETENRSTAKL
ncbi:MAG: hypothetical protein CL933_20240 [Deltaproteobacteria bacterium]|nr:hypothetical protein [Deltaproteobacteria bacterium]